MRPAPRVPSKQLKANSLPAMNLRASSGFSSSEKAGALAMSPSTTMAIRFNIRINPYSAPPKPYRVFVNEKLTMSEPADEGHILPSIQRVIRLERQSVRALYPQRYEGRW